MNVFLRKRVFSVSSCWMRRTVAKKCGVSTITDGFQQTSDNRAHIVFGANTDVGKTVITAGLVRASASQNLDASVHYIKPLQCGGSDQAFVEKHVTQHSNVRGRTLFSWDTATSPHYASRKENLPKSDEEVLSALQKTLLDISRETNPTITWIETAGGAMSPSSSSPLNQLPRHAGRNSWGWSTQADLYQPLISAAPVVLVGDGRLGGISATLSTLESLIIRGYDVDGIVLLETEYDNLSALREYAARPLKLCSVSGAVLFPVPETSIVSLPRLPNYPEPLTEWYESDRVTETLESFSTHLEETWRRRVQELNEIRNS